jgi:transposase-like protein
LVQSLEGSELSKDRLEVILETIAGERTVSEACAALGVSETRLHELRARALEGALANLAPGQPGRPRQAAPDAKDQIIGQLEAEVRELRLELRASLVREEIAVAMPHLLKGEKKTPRRG